MRKALMLLVAAISFVVFKNDVFALNDACTQAEQIRLRQIVNATQITYEFYEEENEEGFFQGFRVSVSNFTSDFYIYDEKQGTLFTYSGNPVVTEGYFVGGTTYAFPFYGSPGTACEGYFIMTKSLSLVRYNPYSEDPLCVGHETYELCKKFTPIKISSRKEFEQRVKQYIKSLETEKPNGETPEEKPTEKTTWQRITDFFIDYYMIFLVSIIIAGTTGIVVIEVKKRRSIL